MQSIPQFNQHGLLPPGRFECSLADIKMRFVNNDHRQRIWSGLESFLNLLKAAGMPSECPLFFDGSFITSKNIPSDIDVVFDATCIAERSTQFRIHRFFFNEYRISKETLLVDACPVLPNTEDFRLYFQQVKLDTCVHERLPPGTQKGILMVTSW